MHLNTVVFIAVDELTPWEFSRPSLQDTPTPRKHASDASGKGSSTKGENGDSQEKERSMNWKPQAEQCIALKVERKEGEGGGGKGREGGEKRPYVSSTGPGRNKHNLNLPQAFS